MGFFLSNQNAYKFSANYIKVRDETPLFEQQRLGHLAHGTTVKYDVSSFKLPEEYLKSRSTKNQLGIYLKLNTSK